MTVITLFFYAPIEIEAFGGEVVYSKDGPPNSGTPFLKKSDIATLKVPDVKSSKPLQKVIEATKMLKEKAGDSVPIIGVVMSPFSLPVMQMGFDKYLELIYEDEALFNQLMKVNEEFCVEWANAQLEAGATAITYFDPVSSTTIIPRDLYLKTGFETAKRTIAQIKGPTATHFASGDTMGIIEDVAKTGTAVIGVSSLEDMRELKKKADKKLTLLGNLNAIEMRNWSREETVEKVKDAIGKAGRGGGFILADHHGEIPYQIKEEILLAIKEAVEKWGVYPLEWIGENE
jgi:uroporphyrinogen decarboxylase